MKRFTSLLTKKLYINVSAGEDKAIVALGLDQIMRRTCLKIVPRTNETAYVSITSNTSDGCWSVLGYTGEKQELNFGSGCVYNVNIFNFLI